MPNDLNFFQATAPKASKKKEAPKKVRLACLISAACINLFYYSPLTRFQKSTTIKAKATPKKAATATAKKPKPPKAPGTAKAPKAKKTATSPAAKKKSAKKVTKETKKQ